MNFLSRFFPLLIVLGLANCSDNKQAAYQAGSQNCSEKFINDYNAIPAAQTAAEARQTLPQVQQFQRTYSGVKCKADKEGRLVTIDVDAEAAQEIQRLNQLIAGG